MNRMHAVLSAGLAAVAVAPALGGVVNALENPGFEEVDEFGFPVGWRLDASGSGSDAIARTGERSLRLDPVSSLQGSAGQGESDFDGVFIPASEGQLWVARAYALTPSTNSIVGTGHRADMGLFFIDDENLVLDSVAAEFIDGQDGGALSDVWIERSMSLLAPTGTVGVGISLRVFTDDDDRFEGQIHFDDASLRLVPGPGAAGLLALGGVAGARRRR